MKNKTSSTPSKEVLEKLEWIASSPVMTETTVLEPILKSHLTPKDTWGKLTVQQGNLKFAWEDTGKTENVNAADSLWIEPNRFHHVEITGPVEFKIDFYRVPANSQRSAKCSDASSQEEKTGNRPGEAFCPQEAVC